MNRMTQLPWRTIAAGLPALALIGGGVVMASTDGSPSTDVVADSSTLVSVPPNALERLEAPVLPPLPELPAPLEESATTFARPVGLPTSMSANGIPAQALAAYQRAATLVDAADAECNIDWALIAAIGKVESNHGRYGGNGIDRDGTVRPGIYGIPLNGSNNTAAIQDTDGGSYDRDPTWDRAVGPMQFIPGTWRTVGVDANGDGRKDPQNITDAATASAVYLCSGPGNLATESGARSAVLRYNQSDAYATEVLAIAAGYRGGYTVVPASDLSAGQRSSTPYLPSGEPQTARRGDAATASKPTPRPAASPGSKPGSTAGTGGTGSGGNPTPNPETTAGTGPVGTVTDVVRGVVGGSTTPSPTPTPTPTPTPSPSPSPTVVPVIGPLGLPVCPAGYLISLDGNSCTKL